MYHRNIFRSSSKVFGNLQKSSEILISFWKMFGIVCRALGTILENLRKVVGNLRKILKKRCQQYLYIIKRTLYHMLARRYEFYVLVARTISHSFTALTREIYSSSCHSNIKFISSRHHVIFSMYQLLLTTFKDHA